MIGRHIQALFISLLISICPFALMGQENNVTVNYSYNQEKEEYVFQAINLNSEHYTVIVLFDRIQNLTASSGIPFVKTIPLGTSRLFTLKKTGSGTPDFSYKYYRFEGTANPKVKEVIYTLPVSPGRQVQVRQVGSVKGLIGQESDEDHYVLGLNMMDGDTIVAARGGEVESIQGGSQTDTLTYSYTRSRNYIRIRHEDGTVARYVNFKNGSLQVELGDWVIPGTPLALATQTSQYGDALVFFEVNYLDLNVQEGRPFREWSRWRYIRPVFETKGFTGVLEKDKNYTSILTDETVIQEMSKREKKKFFSKKNSN